MKGVQRLPLGGKKTASSLSRKRLMRGDKSALTKGIHSPYASPSPIGREAALFTALVPPNHSKSFPVRQPPHKKREKFIPTNPAVAVQGSSGRDREVWRGVTDFATQNLVNSGFAALDSPYERGRPAPPRSSPYYFVSSSSTSSANISATVGLCSAGFGVTSPALIKAHLVRDGPTNS